MVITEEKMYIVGTFLMLVLELFMSVPLATDALLGGDVTIIVIAGIGHVAMWGFGSSGFVRGSENLPHILGVVGVFFTVVPFINFLWHMVVTYFLFKNVIRMVKAEMNPSKPTDE